VRLRANPHWEHAALCGEQWSEGVTDCNDGVVIENLPKRAVRIAGDDDARTAIPTRSD
jgi:hypothetical protein